MKVYLVMEHVDFESGHCHAVCYSRLRAFKERQAIAGVYSDEDDLELGNTNWAVEEHELLD